MSLTVILPVTITAQPESWTGALGETATFTVGAEGDNLSYQWQYRTTPSGSWKNVTAASGKMASYSLTVKERHDGYEYRCVVTGANGEAISNVVSLTIEYTVTITAQPESWAGAIGETATFTVAAEGDDLSYQWQVRKTANGPWNDVTAASGRQASYSLTVKARHNGYEYRCVVTRGDGVQGITDVVSLTVTAPA